MKEPAGDIRIENGLRRECITRAVKPFCRIVYEDERTFCITISIRNNTYLQTSLTLRAIYEHVKIYTRIFICGFLFLESKCHRLTGYFLYFPVNSLTPKTHFHFLRTSADRISFPTYVCATLSASLIRSHF